MNRKFWIIIIIVVLVGIWLIVKERGQAPKVNIPETNLVGGIVAKVEKDRIILTVDEYKPGQGFKRVEKAAILTGATQIVRYSSVGSAYEPIDIDEIRAGDRAQVYFSGSVSAESFDPSLIQITGKQ